MTIRAKCFVYRFSLLLISVVLSSASLPNKGIKLVVMPICVDSNNLESDAIKINRLIDYKLYNYISPRYLLLPYADVIETAGTRKEYCKNPFLEGRKIKEKLNIDNYVSATIAKGNNGIEVNIIMRGDKLWKQFNKIYTSSTSMVSIAEDISLEISKAYK